MQLIEVKDKKTACQFLEVARQLYKADPNFICPLDVDINKILDPYKNAFFKDGNASRWILKADVGTLIGRIAAFYSERKAYRYKQPTGGAGFFECVDDREAAHLLFDTAMKYWTPYVQMDDVAAASRRAALLGASVAVEPFCVVGVARIALIVDPVGAEIGLWEEPPCK